ncbi:MAG: hypothetical protein JW904_13000 [Spirochaetales bacterium]|nr:hypothetical protein [Spirochaetales bacterium]
MRIQKPQNIILFILLVFSCTSVESSPNGQNHVWRYEIEIIAPGTRSEGQIGHLYLNDKEIPAVFDSIIIGETEYIFIMREYLWGFGGYKIVDENRKMVSISSHSVAADELQKGYYPAPFLMKKKDTPLEWVWVKRDTLEAFVNPVILPEFIQEFGLTQLSPFRDALRKDFEK